MTDTRKEFENVMMAKWRHSNPPERVGDSNSYWADSYECAWQSWQACQSLNDKRIENYKSAYETWQDKTEWVQETSTAKELGLHRADVLKKRIEQLLAVIAKKDEALSAVDDLIEHQYCGSKDAMTDLQIACDMTHEALALQPADVELVESGYLDEFDNFEKSIKPWMQEEPNVTWQPVYTIKTKAAK